jgi:hypothetical protein
MSRFVHVPFRRATVSRSISGCGDSGDALAVDVVIVSVTAVVTLPVDHAGMMKSGLVAENKKTCCHAANNFIVQ